MSRAQPCLGQRRDSAGRLGEPRRAGLGWARLGGGGGIASFRHSASGPPSDRLAAGDGAPTATGRPAAAAAARRHRTRATVAGLRAPKAEEMPGPTGQARSGHGQTRIRCEDGD